MKAHNRLDAMLAALATERTAVCNAMRLAGKSSETIARVRASLDEAYIYMSAAAFTLHENDI